MSIKKRNCSSGYLATTDIEQSKMYDNQYDHTPKELSWVLVQGFFLKKRELFPN